MKSIKSLLVELNILRDTNEYRSLSLVDDHIKEIEDRLKKLEARNLQYYCRAHRDIDQVIPTGVPTAVIFTLTDYPQFGNMHDVASFPERFYIRRTGVYHVYGCVHFEAVVGGTYRTIDINLNRGGVVTTIAEFTGPPAGGAVPVHYQVSTAYYFYEEDFITLAVIHDVSPNLDIIADIPHAPVLVAVERREDLDPSQYGLLVPELNMR